MNVDRDALVADLRLHNLVGVRRSAVPILENVSVETKQGYAYLESTNLDVMVRSGLTAAGAALHTTIDRAWLGRVARTLPSGGRLSIMAHGTKLEPRVELVGAGIRAQRSTLPTTEWPETADAWPSKTTVFTPVLALYDAQALRSALHYVAMAAAQDDSRPVLSQVHLRVGQSESLLEATDGFRFHIRPVPHLPHDAPMVLHPGVTKVMFSAAAARTVARALIGYRGTVALRVSENGDKVHFSYDTDRVAILARTYPGDYPDLARVNRLTSPTTVTVPRHDLLRAVRLVRAGVTLDAVLLTLHLEGGLYLTAVDQSYGGEARADLDYAPVGPDVAVKLSFLFLEEALKSADSLNVDIGLHQPGSPAILEMGGSRAGIMPYHSLADMKAEEVRKANADAAG